MVVNLDIVVIVVVEPPAPGRTAVRAFIAPAGVDVEKFADRPDIARLAYITPKFPSINLAAVQALNVKEFDVIIPTHSGAPNF
jgi:hypothetical protein